MGLKKCKDCGGMVSSSARACPNCGCVDRGKYWKRGIIIFVLTVVFLYPAYLIDSKPLGAMIIIIGFLLFLINLRRIIKP